MDTPCSKDTISLSASPQSGKRPLHNNSSHLSPASSFRSDFALITRRSDLPEARFPVVHTKVDHRLQFLMALECRINDTTLSICSLLRIRGDRARPPSMIIGLGIRRGGFMHACPIFSNFEIRARREAACIGHARSAPLWIRRIDNGFRMRHVMMSTRYIGKRWTAQ